MARARTTAVLLIRTEETSNYANVDAAIRPIADKAEAGKPEQHHRPCRRLANDGSGTKSHHLPSVIDAKGFTTIEARQAPEVDDLAVAPLCGDLGVAEYAKSHHLPSGIDAEGVTAGRARQAAQVDDPAVAPLGGDLAPANHAKSHHLPGVIDAPGDTGCGACQAAQIHDLTVAPLCGDLGPGLSHGLPGVGLAGVTERLVGLGYYGVVVSTQYAGAIWPITSGVILLWSGRVIRDQMYLTRVISSSEFTIVRRSSLPTLLLALVLLGLASSASIQLFPPGTPVWLGGVDSSIAVVLLFTSGFVGGLRGAWLSSVVWTLVVVLIQVPDFTANLFHSVITGNGQFPFVEVKYSLPFEGHQIAVPLLDWSFAWFGLATARAMRSFTELPDRSGATVLRPSSYDPREVPAPFRFIVMDKVWSGVAVSYLVVLFIMALVVLVQAPYGPRPEEAVPNSAPSAASEAHVPANPSIQTV